MNIDTSGAYSPDKVYGHLTMPFLEKPVHINAHTPDEEYGDEVLTKSKFYNNQSEMAVNVEDIRKLTGIELNDNLKVDIGIKIPEEFPPEPKVGVFQASVLNDGKGIVYEALRNGYTAEQAARVPKAFSTYQNNMNFLNEKTMQDLSVKMIK